LVKKRQRRLSEVDEVVLSLYAKGLTTGEISAHFADVYDASVSKDTISRITDRVIDEMQAWWNRPLERVYAAVFIDAIMVKVRDGQVGNPPSTPRSGRLGERGLAASHRPGMHHPSEPGLVSLRLPEVLGDQLAKDLRPIYTAVTAEAAAAALHDLEDKWGARYPAIIRLWRAAWAEFTPFLDYDLVHCK
jgi:putative transposase